MRRFSILVKQSCDKTKAKTTGPYWKKKTQNRLETQRSAPPLKFSSVLFLQKRLWIFLPFSLCHFIFKLRHSLQRDRLFLLSALMSEVGEAAAALSPAFQCHSQAVFPITPATAIFIEGIKRLVSNSAMQVYTPTSSGYRGREFRNLLLFMLIRMEYKTWWRFRPDFTVLLSLDLQVQLI